jgi:hypothetical protein
MITGYATSLTTTFGSAAHPLTCLVAAREAAKQFLVMIEARVEAAGNPVNSQNRGYWRRTLNADLNGDLRGSEAGRRFT